MRDSSFIFLDKLNSSFKSDEFVKLVISKPINKDDDLKKVTVRLVEVKNELKLKYVFTHKTKDITKIYNVKESFLEVKELLGKRFKNAVLFSTKNDITISYNKKMKPSLSSSKASYTEKPNTDHNKKKKRLIELKNNEYLRQLEITNEKGEILKNKEDKYKQINKYIETLDSLIKSSELNLNNKINILDMGSGKGYLTFAVYDYLKNKLNIDVKVTGVEIRKDLVDKCNSIASDINYKGLEFHLGSINDYRIEKVDIIIALHACDTATDDAIYKGIISNASIIITAPCCHKQIRNELNVKNELKDITKFGILEERQAEILTDSIRGLILEAEGYKSQVFEFIADAHTHKNVMVVGVKKKSSKNKGLYYDKISKLKSTFGVDKHYLEMLVKKDEKN